MSDLAATIGGAGLRVTPQRLMLLDLLREGGHLSVDDLYQRARVAIPGLSATSIYKSLHALQRAGLVREVRVDAGPLRYETEVGTRHHHRICRSCGRVDDVTCVAEPLDACVGGHLLGDFSVEQVEVTYRGLCAECRRQPDPRRRKERGNRDD